MTLEKPKRQGLAIRSSVVCASRPEEVQVLLNPGGLCLANFLGFGVFKALFFSPRVFVLMRHFSFN